MTFSWPGEEAEQLQRSQNKTYFHLLFCCVCVCEYCDASFTEYLELHNYCDCHSCGLNMCKRSSCCSLKIISPVIREFLAEFLGRLVFSDLTMTLVMIWSGTFILVLLALAQWLSQFYLWGRREASSPLTGGEALSCIRHRTINYFISAGVLE